MYVYVDPDTFAFVKDTYFIVRVHNGHGQGHM